MSLKTAVKSIINNLSTPGKVKDGRWFYPLSSSYNPWRGLQYAESFNCVPELNAVINMKANAFSNGKFKVIDNNGKEFPDHQVLRLLANPNWFQAQKEFMKQTKLFHEIWGNEYLYGNFGVGFKMSDAKALFSLPPNLVKSEYTERLPFFMFKERPAGVNYYLKSDIGRDVPIDSEQIIHFNDNRITIKSGNDKNILNGESKIKALSAPIHNIKIAYESRGVILKYRGANGVLTNKSKDGMGAFMPMEETEKNEIIDSFKSGYGTLEDQSQLIITNQELGWVQMGVNNPQNLGLFQETEEDFNKILDAYGTPAELFVRKQGSTYENQNQARKGFYTETIIPEAGEWTAGLSNRFFPDGKFRIILDYMHLPVFQEDLKKKGDALQVIVTALSKALQDKAITIDEYMAELNKYGIGLNQNN